MRNSIGGALPKHRAPQFREAHGAAGPAHFSTAASSVEPFQPNSATTAKHASGT
jgi:hypothetical protein